MITKALYERVKKKHYKVRNTLNEYYQTAHIPQGQLHEKGGERKQICKIKSTFNEHYQTFYISQERLYVKRWRKKTL